MAFESRPGEPGYSGRATGSLLDAMNTAMGGHAKVRAAQFVGFNTKGQKEGNLQIPYGNPPPDSGLEW